MTVWVKKNGKSYEDIHIGRRLTWEKPLDPNDDDNYDFVINFRDDYYSAPGYFYYHPLAPKIIFECVETCVRISGSSEMSLPSVVNGTEYLSLRHVPVI